MAEKLTSAITVKLGETAAFRGSALAQRKGMCFPEFIRHLIDKAIDEAEAEYRDLSSIFGTHSDQGEGNAE